MFNSIKPFRIVATLILTFAYVSLFSAEFASTLNLWEKNHLVTDGRGGFYNQKPGKSLWEADHIIPDSRGGYYIQKPGSSLHDSPHITSDGLGGFYY